MELKEFIKSVVREVTDAVKESQAEITNGAVIVPSEEIDGEIRTRVSRRYVTMIRFDVKVTASSYSEKEKGLRVCSSILGGINDTKGVTEEDKSSRIEFTIPVILPSKVS